MVKNTTDPCELRRLFLFEGLTDSRLQALLGQLSPETAEYKKGETVYSPIDFQKKLGFILCGSCRVCMCRGGGDDLSLNTLGASESFGALALFCEGEYPTTVCAREDTRILFFTKEDILHLIGSDGTVSLNMMRFLAGRVDFLNKKLRALTAKDAEGKLAAWLLQNGSDEPFLFHATRVAQALGCGRASLYRSLDALVCAGAITYFDRKIKIINKDLLERITS